MNEEQVTVPRELALHVWDLATSSLDAGSGFWDVEDEAVVYVLGRMLGVLWDKPRRGEKEFQEAVSRLEGRFEVKRS